MNWEEYRTWAHRAVDWGTDYRADIRDRPVRAQVKPGDIARQIASAPPETGEDMADIFAEFEAVIPDGMTHWQHPRFMAYFSANAAPASMVAEHLATALASNAMLWQTSPAATELEQVMVDWLRQAVGLSDGWKGVLQDTASSLSLIHI